jgi:hypothetical protein
MQLTLFLFLVISIVCLFVTTPPLMMEFDFDKRTLVESFDLLQSPAAGGNVTNTTATTLTPDQLYALQLTTKFTASASMLGSGLIILSYIIFPMFRSVNNRLVLYLSIAGAVGFDDTKCH